MKIFLDTAAVAEIRRAAEAGLIDGVTTNPSLLATAADGRDPEEIFLDIATTVDGPVSAEVIAVETPDMVEEGRRLAGIHDNIVVKVPLTEDGLAACRRLSSEGIAVNVTLCFSAPQALLAAKAGATFVSPFVGRLDDIGHDGMALVADIRQIYDSYGIGTQILTASVRHPGHVVEALRIGSDCATIPPKVLYQLLKHPLTDVGLERFLKDWRTLGLELVTTP